MLNTETDSKPIDLSQFTANELTNYLVADYMNVLRSNDKSGNSNNLSIAGVIEKLKKEGHRQVCQAQFCKNDIVWMCKTCQRDETCVICNDCYHASNHEGHEVYFYHSQAGGCCDCGDEDAWKKSGTCSKHGNIIEDPFETVPPAIIDAGQNLLPQLVDRILEIISNYALAFTEPLKTVDDFRSKDVETLTCRIYLSENHEVREYKEIVMSVLGIPPHQLDQYYIRQVVPRGCIDFYPTKSVSPKQLSEVANIYFILKKKQFQVCILSKEVIEAESLLIVALKWIITLSQVNDGLCCLFCLHFTEIVIEKLLVNAIYLPKYCVVLIHDMMLALMANPKFKIVASLGYMNAFTRCMDLFGRGIGLQEHNIFSFSVQFLNRPVVVHDIVQYHWCLHKIWSAFVNMMQQGIADRPFPGTTSTYREQYSLLNVKSRRNYRSILQTAIGQIEPVPMDMFSWVLKSRRYMPLISDIRFLFDVREISRVFCTFHLKDWLYILSLLQYIHPQQRVLGVHVSYEDTSWMPAFNLTLTLNSVFHLMYGWTEGFGGGEGASVLDSKLNAESLKETKTAMVESVHMKLFQECPCNQQGNEPVGRYYEYPVQSHQEPDFSVRPALQRYRLMSAEMLLCQCFEEVQNWCVYSSHGVNYSSTDAYVDMLGRSGGSSADASLNSPDYPSTTVLGQLWQTSNHMVYLPKWDAQSPQKGIYDCSTLTVRKLPLKRSFHLYLHRFFSSTLRACMPYAHLTNAVKSLQRNYIERAPMNVPFGQQKFVRNTYVNSKTETSTTFYPQDAMENEELPLTFALSTLLFGVEIKAGLWVLNGQNIQEQLYHYCEAPYSTNARDLDVLFVQLYIQKYATNRKKRALVEKEAESNEMESDGSFCYKPREPYHGNIVVSILDKLGIYGYVHHMSTSVRDDFLMSIYQHARGNAANASENCSSIGSWMTCPLSVGQLVEARYANQSKWNLGTVSAIVSSDTVYEEDVPILFHDYPNGVVQHIPRWHVRPVVSLGHGKENGSEPMETEELPNEGLAMEMDEKYGRLCSNTYSVEVCNKLVEETLTLLTQLVTQLPPPPAIQYDVGILPEAGASAASGSAEQFVDSNSDSRFKHSTLRYRVKQQRKPALVHKLALGPASYSSLMDCLNGDAEYEHWCQLVEKYKETEDVDGSDKLEGTVILDEMLAEMADFKPAGAGGDTDKDDGHSEIEQGKYTLKAEYWSHYDPTYTGVGQKLHQQLIEDRPKVSVVSPMVAPLSSPHEVFNEVRSEILGNHSLLRVLHVSLIAYASSRPNAHSVYTEKTKSWMLTTNSTIFSRVLHLLTLVFHQFADFESTREAVGTSDSESGWVASKQALGEYLLMQPIVYIHQSGIVPVNGLQSDGSSAVVWKQRLPSMLQTLIDIEAGIDENGADGKKTESGVDKQESNMKYWLKWCIQQSSRLNESCKAIVDMSLAAIEEAKNAARAKLMAQKRQAARDRAMTMMKSSAAAFSEKMKMELDIESEEEEEASSGGSCIICQLKPEEDLSEFLANGKVDGAQKACGNVLAYMALCQPSGFGCTSFSHLKDSSDLKSDTNSEAHELVTTAKPVVIEGNTTDVVTCRTPDMLTKVMSDIVPAKESRMREQPAALHINSNVSQICENENSLSSSDTSAPLHNSPIGQSLHFQYCGHAVHIGCFDTYLARLLDDSLSPYGSNRNSLLFELNNGQFPCPLCKKICNRIVPDTSQVLTLSNKMRGKVDMGENSQEKGGNNTSAAKEDAKELKCGSDDEAVVTMDNNAYISWGNWLNVMLSRQQICQQNESSCSGSMSVVLDRDGDPVPDLYRNSIESDDDDLDEEDAMNSSSSSSSADPVKTSSTRKQQVNYLTQLVYSIFGMNQKTDRDMDEEEDNGIEGDADGYDDRDLKRSKTSHRQNEETGDTANSNLNENSSQKPLSLYELHPEAPLICYLFATYLVKGSEISAKYQANWKRALERITLPAGPSRQKCIETGASYYEFKSICMSISEHARTVMYTCCVDEYCHGIENQFNSEAYNELSHLNTLLSNLKHYLFYCMNKDTLNGMMETYWELVLNGNVKNMNEKPDARYAYVSLLGEYTIDLDICVARSKYKDLQEVSQQATSISTLNPVFLCMLNEEVAYLDAAETETEDEANHAGVLKTWEAATNASFLSSNMLHMLVMGVLYHGIDCDSSEDDCHPNHSNRKGNPDAIKHLFSTLCIANLVQLVIIELETLPIGIYHDLNSSYASLPKSTAKLQQCIHLVRLIADKVISSDSNRPNRSLSSENVAAILFKWCVFLRSAAHIMSRICPLEENSSPESQDAPKDMNVKKEMIRSHRLSQYLKHVRQMPKDSAWTDLPTSIYESYEGTGRNRSDSYSNDTGDGVSDTDASKNLEINKREVLLLPPVIALYLESIIAENEGDARMDFQNCVEGIFDDYMTVCHMSVMEGILEHAASECNEETVGNDVKSCSYWQLIKNWIESHQQYQYYCRHKQSSPQVRTAIPSASSMPFMVPITLLPLPQQYDKFHLSVVNMVSHHTNMIRSLKAQYSSNGSMENLSTSSDGTLETMTANNRALDYAHPAAPSTEISMEAPAVCLLCGMIVSACGKGLCHEHLSFHCPRSRSVCGLHVNDGIGLFFMIQDGTILVCFGPRCYSMPAPYSDIYGESKAKNSRGRPLKLDHHKLKSLVKSVVSHAIPREVVQKRSSIGRVIINNYY